MLLQSFAFPQLSLAYFQRHDPVITTDGVLSHRDSRNIRFMRRLNESAENQLRLVTINGCRSSTQLSHRDACRILMTKNLCEGLAAFQTRA
jgi:hypothetical protein